MPLPVMSSQISKQFQEPGLGLYPLTFPFSVFVMVRHILSPTFFSSPLITFVVGRSRLENRARLSFSAQLSGAWTSIPVPNELQTSRIPCHKGEPFFFFHKTPACKTPMCKFSPLTFPHEFRLLHSVSNTDSPGPLLGVQPLSTIFANIAFA